MASDRFGRRPTLLLGPLGLALALLGFGMSSQFWCLVFFRWFQGAFNGNIGRFFLISPSSDQIYFVIGIAKSVIGEVLVLVQLGRRNFQTATDYRLVERRRSFCSHTSSLGFWSGHWVCTRLMFLTTLTLTPISPFIGGLLARPADEWPDTLGRIGYLKAHPYFLPCFAVAVIAFFSFLSAFVLLKEVNHPSLFAILNES